MKKIIYLLSLSVFAFVGCEEDNPEPDTNDDNTNNTTVTPEFSDADGTLVAVRTKSGVGPFAITTGIGVAVFSDNGDFTSPVNAGDVSVNGTALVRGDNNAYYSIPGIASPTGINFNSSVDWVVSGSSDVDAFTHSPAQRNFPEVNGINGGAVVNKSMDYTLSANSITDADSVVFMVQDVLVTADGSTTSYTFSAAELSGIDVGTGIAQVVGYNFETQTINGQNYYFVKETVLTQFVTVEE